MLKKISSPYLALSYSNDHLMLKVPAGLLLAFVGREEQQKEEKKNLKILKVEITLSMRERSFSSVILLQLCN